MRGRGRAGALRAGKPAGAARAGVGVGGAGWNKMAPPRREVRKTGKAGGEQRLPYTVAAIERLMDWKAGGSPLAAGGELPRGGTLLMGEERLRRSNYGEPRGELKALAEALAGVVGGLGEDGGNYREILRLWFATLMDGVMRYGSALRVAGGEVRAGVLRPASGGVPRYEALYDRYERVFARSFVAEDVSAEDNYEELEFLGDGVYKNALVFYLWRERRIRNKSILTVLKHTHENTKALSDLARLLSMDVLIRSKGAKHPDETREDVFEAVLGVLQIVEWEIQRDPRNPESAQFAASGGFAARLVRMIFENSDARYEDRIPPKTFLTTLSGAFAAGQEGLRSTEKVDADRQIISFRAPAAVVSQIAGTFGADPRALSRVLNARYESAEGSVHAKHFSQVVHDDVVERLRRLGVTQHALYAHANRARVPPEFRQAFDGLGAEAQAKNFWLGVNVPKTARRAGAYEINATFYHDDPHRSLPRAQVEAQGEAHRHQAFAELLARATALLRRTPPARPPPPEKRRDMSALFELTPEDPEDPADPPAAPGGAPAPPRHRPQAPWAADAARTVVDGGGPILAGIAGAKPDERPRGPKEAHTSILEGTHDTLQPETLLGAAADPALLQALRAELRAPGPRPASVLLEAPGGGYAHLTITRGDPPTARSRGALPPAAISALQALGVVPAQIDTAPLDARTLEAYLHSVAAKR